MLSLSELLLFFTTSTDLHRVIQLLHHPEHQVGVTHTYLPEWKLGWGDIVVLFFLFNYSQL